VHVVNIVWIVCIILDVKCVPQQAQCGPVGSRRFRLPDFMTFGT